MSPGGRSVISTRSCCHVPKPQSNTSSWREALPLPALSPPPSRLGAPALKNPQPQASSSPRPAPHTPPDPIPWAGVNQITRR